MFVSQDASGDFESLPWFTAVETFCHGHGHEELEHTDRQTLSNIIEKTVLPKITGNKSSSPVCPHLFLHSHNMLCLRPLLLSICGVGVGSHVPPTVSLSLRRVSQTEGGLLHL